VIELAHGRNVPYKTYKRYCRTPIQDGHHFRRNFII